jgi:hypothetical protein
VVLRLNVFRVLHILDSLRDHLPVLKDGKALQNILLKYFEDESFKEGRIATNVAQAIALLSLLSFD